MSEKAGQLKKFDLVNGHEIDLAVIISEPFTAHFFDPCLGSQGAEIPFDLTDPSSYWIEVDDMVLLYVFAPNFRGIEAVRLCNLAVADIDRYSAYALFDCATDKLREVLSLKKYAENF